MQQTSEYNNNNNNNKSRLTDREQTSGYQWGEGKGDNMGAEE